MMRWDGSKVLVPYTRAEGRLEVSFAVDDAKWGDAKITTGVLRRWESDSWLTAIETRALPTYSGLGKDDAELNL